jgi:hypothetical protein
MPVVYARGADWPLLVALYGRTVRKSTDSYQHMILFQRSPSWKVLRLQICGCEQRGLIGNWALREPWPLLSPSKPKLRVPLLNKKDGLYRVQNNITKSVLRSCTPIVIWKLEYWFVLSVQPSSQQIIDLFEGKANYFSVYLIKNRKKKIYARIEPSTAIGPRHSSSG